MKKTLFDNLVENMLQELNTTTTTQVATNPNNSNAQNAAINISPAVVSKYKQNILLPMANGDMSKVDPNLLKQAINDGVIEDHGDNIYAVSDTALQHVNRDPQLQGKFLPSQQAVAQAKDSRVQGKKVNTQAQQTTQKPQPQTPTTGPIGATSYNPLNTSK